MIYLVKHSNKFRGFESCVFGLIKTQIDTAVRNSFKLYCWIYLINYGFLIICYLLIISPVPPPFHSFLTSLSFYYYYFISPIFPRFSLFIICNNIYKYLCTTSTYSQRVSISIFFIKCVFSYILIILFYFLYIFNYNFFI